MLNEADLQREAAATGFRPEALVKVIQLLNLLEGFSSHPFLKDRIALKGGTAINLFVLDTPRLSVDIDINYIGAVDREVMLEERPKVGKAVQAVCGRSGIQVRHSPTDHAGGKWRLSYNNVAGLAGSLELDINFMLRSPLWPVTLANSKRIGSFGAKRVPMLEMHELVAGKLAALFGRSTSRDLFDVRELFNSSTLDMAKLRLGFIVYGGINRRDWRTITLDEVRTDPDTVDRELLPLLGVDSAPARSEIKAWTDRLVSDCRKPISRILPLRKKEIEFLEHLNERGEIRPELLTDDSALQDTIRSHPGLLWKALNVKQHRGLIDAAPP